MARTYLPTLRYWLKRTNQYIADHQAEIQSGLTPTQQTAFAGFIACLAELILSLGAEPINP